MNIYTVRAIILAVYSTFNKPVVALRYIYAEIFLVTAGSMEIQPSFISSMWTELKIAYFVME